MVRSTTTVGSDTISSWNRTLVVVKTATHSGTPITDLLEKLVRGDETGLIDLAEG